MTLMTTRARRGHVTPRLDDLHITKALATRLQVLSIVWGFQGRGLRLKVDGDLIVACPRNLLRPEDYAVVRRWQMEIAAVLEDGEGLAIH